MNTPNRKYKALSDEQLVDLILQRRAIVRFETALDEHGIVDDIRKNLIALANQRAADPRFEDFFESVKREAPEDVEHEVGQAAERLASRLDSQMMFDAAAELFVHRFGKMIIRIAYQIAGQYRSLEHAIDKKAAFTAVYEHLRRNSWGGLRTWDPSRGSLDTWLGRVTRHLLINIAQQNNPRLIPIELDAPVGEGRSAPLTDLLAGDENVEDSDVLSSERFSQILQECVRKQSSMHQEFIDLKSRHDLKFEEIATHFGYGYRWANTQWNRVILPSLRKCVSLAGRHPCPWVFVLDASSTMSGASERDKRTKAKHAEEISEAVIERLSESDYVGLLSLGSQVKWLRSMGIGGEPEVIELQVEDCESVDVDAALDEASRAIDDLEPPDVATFGHPVLIFLTDGCSASWGNSVRSVKDASAEGAQIIIAGLGPKDDRIDALLMSMVSEESDYFRAPKEWDYERMISRVTHAQKSRGV